MTYPRRRLPVPPRRDPHPDAFVPKHCAGTRCVHAHPGDVPCHCGGIVLPEGVEVQVMSVRGLFTGTAPTPFVRHSRDFCGKVAAPVGATS